MSTIRPECAAPPVPSPARRRQGGFAILAAIFILVVLASLGAYVLTISSAQHIGSALDTEGSRALQAARAGMDWGIERAIDDPAHFGAGNCRTATVSVHLNTTGADFPSLAAYTVSVSCTGTPSTDGADVYNYALIAVACNHPGTGTCPAVSPPANYVERKLTAQIICNASLPC